MNIPVSQVVSEYSDRGRFRAPEPGKPTFVPCFSMQFPIFQSTKIVDVLGRHQQRNGRPRVPDPAALTALHDQSMATAEMEVGSDDDSLCKRPRHARC